VRARTVRGPAGTSATAPPAVESVPTVLASAVSAPAAPPVQETPLAGSDGRAGVAERPPEAGSVASPPGSSRERAARSLKSRRPAPASMGLLDVRAHPYANVSVDGRPVGTTPLDAPLELAVGSYTVKFFSPTLSRTETRRVEVKAGKTTPLTVSFSQTE
jgi:eukaryotic-like serine/threonine-protein kinase